jgi:hypothetical protein
VVTLQLASSQFSPRLLRTFSQDRFAHVTLAMFLATFTYALTVLRTVRTGNDGQDVFVPQISVTFAFLLVLASVIGLVLFLAHLAREIRVETMLKKVHSDATGTLRGLLPPRGETRAPGERLPTPPIDAWPLLAPSSGFLTSVDDERLLETAVANDVVVWLDHQPGGSLIRGAPMGAFWPFDGADVDAEEQSRLHLRPRTYHEPVRRAGGGRSVAAGDRPVAAGRHRRQPGRRLLQLRQSGRLRSGRTARGARPRAPCWRLSLRRHSITRFRARFAPRALTQDRRQRPPPDPPPAPSGPR